MKPLSKVILVVCVVLPVVISTIVFVRYDANDTVWEELQIAFPEFAERIEADVAVLNRESLDDSLGQLSRADMFYWPGAQRPSFVLGGGVPLRKDVGQIDLETIMSNRRFRKILEELEGMDNTAASELVSREIAKAISEYLPLWEAKVRDMSPHFEASRKGGTGPIFRIGGEGTVVGARLKVLSLVWLSGLLGLGNTQDMEAVTRLALKQREGLYNDATVSVIFKADMLERGSLYNRQILVTGLLGAVGPRGSETPEGVTVEWEERRLKPYTSPLTEYDLPVRLGVMRPDPSRRDLRVKFVSTMDDESFDTILRAKGVLD